MNAIDTSLLNTKVSYEKHTLNIKYLFETYTDDICFRLLEVLQHDAKKMESIPNAVFISRRVHFISQLLRKGVGIEDLEEALQTEFM